MVDVEGVEVLLKKIKVNLNNDIKGIYLWFKLIVLIVILFFEVMNGIYDKVNK